MFQGKIMQFATSIVIEQESFKAGQEVAKQAVLKLKPLQPKLVILFCSSRYDYSRVIRGVQSVIGENVLLIGCTAAGMFTEEAMTKEGVGCAMISSESYRFFAGIGTQLKSSPVKAIQNAIITFPKEVEEGLYQSAILFIDGLVGKGEEAVLAASSLLGPQVKFAGAAAADNLSFQETTVFCNQQTLSDAVSICLIASQFPVIISVNHGHHPISPAFRVTKAKDNILYELDGRPALEVWKDVLRERLKAQQIDVDSLSLTNLSKLLLQYEAGLMTGSEYKIRFPSSCNNDGSLNFVSPILEGSVIKIMNSSQKDQIDSARYAAETALKLLPQGAQIAGALIFDCACRAMILKEQFSKVIEANRQVLRKIPFLGCETYGEIAMDIGQLSGFHNTSTVMMLFPS